MGILAPYFRAASGIRDSVQKPSKSMAKLGSCVLVALP